METQFNGAIIVASQDETQKVLDLECVCGHKLKSHGSYVGYYLPDSQHNTFYQSQCLLCENKNDKFGCERFRIK